MTTFDPEVADAPTGMPYQRYWDDEEYRADLQHQIAEAIRHGVTAIDDLPYAVADMVAATIMERVFKRVKLHTRCAIGGCSKPGCPPSHYTFNITTHPRWFAPAIEEDRP